MEEGTYIVKEQHVDGGSVGRAVRVSGMGHHLSFCMPVGRYAARWESGR